MTWLPQSPGSTLVLWLNQEIFHRLHLAVLATMRPALEPAGHRVPRTKSTCLLHTWRPHSQRPFAFVLHLRQHESSCNLHLQYLAKNQSTQHCQSLITPGNDHPPVLEPHRSSNFAPSRTAARQWSLGRGSARAGEHSSVARYSLSLQLDTTRLVLVGVDSGVSDLAKEGM
jgi:hypothetical protein